MGPISITKLKKTYEEVEKKRASRRKKAKIKIKRKAKKKAKKKVKKKVSKKKGYKAPRIRLKKRSFKAPKVAKEGKPYTGLATAPKGTKAKKAKMQKKGGKIIHIKASKPQPYEKLSAGQTRHMRKDYERGTKKEAKYQMEKKRLEEEKKTRRYLKSLGF